MDRKVHGRENDSVEVVPEVVKSEVALREEEVQKFWEENDIFNKSVEKPAGGAPKGDYVFFDGPPFATGTPHYGHLLGGTLKDAVPRFWTMNGFRVRRKWGWDCHGLPLENLIEKKLGLANKKDIEDFGIKNFNEEARDAVMEYADDWARVVPRMGRWVDMENDYRTMDSSYTESVWWVFKSLHDKGLVYEGFKSMHLCPRCGTTLSNFEVNQGYKDIKDIAVTVKMPILDDEGKVTDTNILIWTTTPWTLPGNMAAAVNEEIDYVKVKVTVETGVEFVILAKERLVQLGDVEYEVVEEMKGSDLIGLSYQPPFDYITKQGLEGKDKAWKIYHADYVEVGEDGTGIVHIAPAFGDDDLKLAQEHGVPIVHHVDYEGRFKDFVTDFAGQLVKPRDDDSAGTTHLDADIKVLRHLQAAGKIFAKENITHSYPHCWRDETPLLNYATTSWFVKVTDIKDKLVAENNKVNWVPDHVGSSRFGKWLEGARDWAVSRQRYWGSPLPIWKNGKTEEYKVFGSLAEMQEFVPKSGNQYFIMRHGESESNANDVIQTDIEIKNELTETGKEQVANEIERLKDLGITRIIASPFGRTRETASLVKDGLGLEDEMLTHDDRLGEIQLGEFEGKLNGVYQEFVLSEAQWCECSPEGGETWTDVRNRVGEFLYEIENKYKNEKILIVSHNSPLRMFAVVIHGSVLADTDFNHDEDGKRYGNAEVKESDFTPMPHNENYELDFHRPYIDKFELFEGEDKLERVPEVFDCWFESGSMPYGQHHYPFENKEDFEKERFPAQFIAEGLDQTRGWFYSLIVLGTALFGKSPYENVIVNGIVLAEDGKKMSKSLNNYPDPMELVDRVGADAVRFYLLSSPAVRGEDVSFSEKEVLELQRKNIGRLHNVLAMYEMFSDKTKASGDSGNVLDRWIVARLNELIAESTAGYKAYEIDKATRPVTDFIDDLSVWYLRRSRDRFKGEDIEDKTRAIATLRFVLRELSKVMAPVMPFYAEYLWKAVRAEGEAESVHLSEWPQGGSVDDTLLKTMSEVRTVISEALELRTKANIKVRQPLLEVRISEGVSIPDEFKSIIQDELNVKVVKTQYKLGAETGEFIFTGQTTELTTELTHELLNEGYVREFIRSVQVKRKAEGLAPQDPISLTIETSKEGEAIIVQFQSEIQKVVGATSVVFAKTEGLEIKAGEHIFVTSLTKL
jgi:isoleucyl-tRNA synthetase